MDTTQKPTSPAPQTVTPVTQTSPVAAQSVIDINTLKTPSGKMVKDFDVPAALKEKDAGLIDLIMRSESMNDSERQYWFSLTEVMTPDQVEKLRDILTRERQKLAEIEAKYGPAGQTEPKMSAEEIARRNADIAQKQAAKKAEIAQKEAEAKAEEKGAEDILSQL